MIVTREGNELLIRIPLTEPTLSSTGKTYSVATSSGNKPTAVKIDGHTIVVGVNAYYKA
jgi:hypothetical protein